MPKKKTAWGAWVDKQPHGVLTDAQVKTGIGWSTLNKAKFQRMSKPIANLLSLYTGGEVAAAEIAKQTRSA